MMKTIRKFGLQMEYCDLPTMLWNVTVLWRPLTLNIDKRITKRIPLHFYVSATVISLSCFYVYVISMIWFVFIKCSETGDIVAATVVFSLGTASQIGTFKLIFMFLRQNKIRDLVKAYLGSDATEVSTSRYTKNVQKILRVVKTRAVAFWLVIIGNGFVYWAKPLILPGRHLSEDLFIYYGLEPMYDSPNYEIAVCVTTLGILFTVYIPANITALLIVTAGYTEARMLSLSEEIQCLWKDAEDYCKSRPVSIKNRIKCEKTILNKYVHTVLTEIVRRHIVSIDLVRKTEDIFRDAIAMEFTLLSISLISALLGGLETTYLEMPFSLMQVSMDCLIGQKLMDASVVFENAVYDSKWENFNVGNRRTLLLLLHNSQKSLTLSAGGLTMLSFTSLKYILKTIYSTYTTLRSVL